MTSPSFVGFVDAVKLFFSNYANFKGRSTRSEFWYATLFSIIVNIVLFVLSAISGAMLFFVLSWIWGLAILIPSFSINIRRLHDIGKSWLSILLGLIPLAGTIILLVFYAKESGPDNPWGAAAK